MKVHISEFSYAYAFTEDLRRSEFPFATSFPFFLPQLFEAKYGFDMMITLESENWDPYFFQFKIPDLMVRNNASEISKFRAGVSVPYYRMKLYRKASYRQQNALADLESQLPRTVFYATPEFHEAYDLCKYLHLGTVIQNSALFSPLDIRNAKNLSSNVNHTIAYEPQSLVGYLCSKPEEIKNYAFKEVLKKNRNSRSKTERPTREKLEKLIGSVLFAINRCGYEIHRSHFDSEVNKYIERHNLDDDADKEKASHYNSYYKILTLGEFAKEYINSNMYIVFDEMWPLPRLGKNSTWLRHN